MRTAYLVLGYGVPDDIFTDANYGTYLPIVLNAIWSDPAKNKIVLFAGGRTDVRPPYRRSEAGEMLKFFRRWARRRELRDTIESWQVASNPLSLSAPESLSWFVEYLNRVDFDRTAVFCERTRRKRIESLTQELVGPEVFRDGRAVVMGIDFDTSANRYRPLEEIKEREQAELDLDTWALESPVNLHRHRQLREERLKFLRAAGPKRHIQAIQGWEQHEPEVRKRLGIPV